MYACRDLKCEKNFMKFEDLVTLDYEVEHTVIKTLTPVYAHLMRLHSIW